MKKLVTIIACIIMVTLISSCSSKLIIGKNVEITSPAYMYNQELNINKEVKVMMSGFFNEEEDFFEGTLTIEDIYFSKVLFSSGTGLISYDGKERTFSGQIYYDEQTHAYSMELSDKELLRELTGNVLEDGTLIISSPADTLGDAMEINEDLKEKTYNET
ncbi:hypothetical protein [Paenibacillus sp. CMAA1364]